MCFEPEEVYYKPKLESQWVERWKVFRTFRTVRFNPTVLGEDRICFLRFPYGIVPQGEVLVSSNVMGKNIAGKTWRRGFSTFLTEEDAIFASENFWDAQVWLNGLGQPIENYAIRKVQCRGLLAKGEYDSPWSSTKKPCELYNEMRTLND